jgi:hypothetical protein
MPHVCLFSLHVHCWLEPMTSPVGEARTRIQADQIGELQHRQVRIYRPTKSTMQSAKGKTKKWILDWDVLSGSGRWENPLMGWASSADYMQGTTMAFRSQEDAVAFVRQPFPSLMKTMAMLIVLGREARVELLCSETPRAQDSRQELWYVFLFCGFEPD